MYTVTNYKRKKDLIADVKAGKKVRVYQPNSDLFGGPSCDGRVSLEGPHYPAMHTWYASATIKDCIIQKVK